MIDLGSEGTGHIVEQNWTRVSEAFHLKGFRMGGDCHEWGRVPSNIEHMTALSKPFLATGYGVAKAVRDCAHRAS